MKRVGLVTYGGSCERSNLIAEARRPPAGQQLEGDRREREHVCWRAPRLAVNALGGAVGPSDRRAQANPFEGVDHAKAGRAGFIGRYKNVARMERAMPNPGRPCEIDRAGELGDEWKHLVERGRRIVAHGDVEGLGRDVFVGAVRHRPLNARRDWLDDRRVEQPGFGGSRKLVR